MSEGGLLISWGDVHPGREGQAVRLFGDVLAYYGRLAEEGRITGYEPFIVAAHGGGLRGFIILRGEREQLNELTGEDEFMGYTMRAQMCLNEFGIEEVYFGEALGHVMQLYEHEVGALA